MAAETIQLEILTPTGVALRERVSEVTAPSVSGEFGVLPGHVPLLAALRTGLVSYKKDGELGRAAIYHGFAEVKNDQVSVLTERYLVRADVDVVGVRSRLKEVDDELDHWKGELTDPRRRDLIEEEQWLGAQLELIGDPPPPTVREETRFLSDHAEAGEPEPEDERQARRHD